MSSLTDHEKEKFISWVKSNVDDSMVPSDENNSDALIYNLVHAIRGDRERYEYKKEQDDDIMAWKLRNSIYL